MKKISLCVFALTTTFYATSAHATTELRLSTGTMLSQSFLIPSGVTVYPGNNSLYAANLGGTLLWYGGDIGFGFDTNFSVIGASGATLLAASLGPVIHYATNMSTRDGLGFFIEPSVPFSVLHADAGRSNGTAYLVAPAMWMGLQGFINHNVAITFGPNAGVVVGIDPGGTQGFVGARLGLSTYF